MLSRKQEKHQIPFLYSQEALNRQAPLSHSDSQDDLLNPPTSLPLLPCPSYLDKWEQRNYPKPPLRTSLATYTSSQAFLNYRENNEE